jgi:hypothetical protein
MTRADPICLVKSVFGHQQDFQRKAKGIYSTTTFGNACSLAITVPSRCKTNVRIYLDMYIWFTSPFKFWVGPSPLIFSSITQQWLEEHFRASSHGSLYCNSSICAYYNMRYLHPHGAPKVPHNIFVVLNSSLLSMLYHQAQIIDGWVDSHNAKMCASLSGIIAPDVVCAGISTILWLCSPSATEVNIDCITTGPV